MNLKLQFSILFGLALGVIPTAHADVNCNTDCGDVAAFNYPCPTLRNPRRICRGREPGLFLTCEATKKSACEVFKPIGEELINGLAGLIAEDPKVKAEAGGWNMANCAIIGAPLILGVETMYSVPICAAFNVAAPACGGFIAASSALVTAAVCVQLCNDHKLSDCK